MQCCVLFARPSSCYCLAPFSPTKCSEFAVWQAFPRVCAFFSRPSGTEARTCGNTHLHLATTRTTKPALTPFFAHLLRFTLPLRTEKSHIKSILNLSDTCWLSPLIRFLLNELTREEPLDKNRLRIFQPTLEFLSAIGGKYGNYEQGYRLVLNGLVLKGFIW